VPQPRPIAPVWPREITKSTQSAAVLESELRPRRPANSPAALGQRDRRTTPCSAAWWTPPSEATAPVERDLAAGPWRTAALLPGPPPPPSTTSAWVITRPRPASVPQTKPAPGFRRRAYLDDLSTPPIGGPLSSQSANRYARWELMKCHEKYHPRWWKSLPFADPLHGRQEPALKRQIQHVPRWDTGQGSRTQ
jgi:hypothetical protein